MIQSLLNYLYFSWRLINVSIRIEARVIQDVYQGIQLRGFLIMKNALLALFVIFPLLSVGCLNYSEHDYDRGTGTFSIPFGEKEGKRNPDEVLMATDGTTGNYGTQM